MMTTPDSGEMKRKLDLKTIRADLEVLIEPADRRRWLLLLAFAVVGAGIETIGALLIFYVTNWLVGSETTGGLWGLLPPAGPEGVPSTLIWLIAGFFVFRGLFLLYSTWYQARVVHYSAARISERLFARYLFAPYQVYLNRSSPDLMRTTLSSVEGVAMRYLTPLVAVVTEAIVVAVLVAVLLVTAPLATAAVVAVMGIASLIVMRVVRTRLRRYGKQAERTTQSSLATIQQSFNESRSIRLLARERYFADAFNADRRDFAESRLYLTMYSKVPRTVIETLVFLLLVGFLSQVSEAEVVGVFGLFGYAALRIMPGLNHIVSGVNLIRYGQASTDNVVEELRGHYMDEAELLELGGPVDRLQWSQLVLENVSFRYNETAPPAVVNASLTVERGELLGLVGQTGSGKSTLIDLVLGLLEPTGGRVLVDGQDISAVKRGWQANLGLVPQDIFLLDDSILKNVAFGLPDGEIDRAKVLECLRIAQLSELLERSEHGVESRIGERGTALSGGERQRIAIARALYASPSVLILDEGTSAIDTVTELNLVNELRRSDVIDTVIVVSHRLSSLRICDTVAIMDHGVIADRGAYDDLVLRNPVLADLSRSST